MLPNRKIRMINNFDTTVFIMRRKTSTRIYRLSFLNKMNDDISAKLIFIWFVCYSRRQSSWKNTFRFAIVNSGQKFHSLCNYLNVKQIQND